MDPSWVFWTTKWSCLFSRVTLNATRGTETFHLSGQWKANTFHRFLPILEKISFADNCNHIFKMHSSPQMTNEIRWRNRNGWSKGEANSSFINKKILLFWGVFYSFYICGTSVEHRPFVLINPGVLLISASVMCQVDQEMRPLQPAEVWLLYKPSRANEPVRHVTGSMGLKCVQRRPKSPVRKK